MKALVFVDLHEIEEGFRSLESKAKEANIIIGAGDYSVFGKNLKHIVERIDRIGKPCYLIHGNHESIEEMEKALKNCKNTEFIHSREVKFKDYKLIGWGGGGFEHVDKEFKKFAEGKEINQKTIMLFHGPPLGTKLDEVDKDIHTGNKSYREIIEEKQPLLVICGHIHQTAGEIDKIKKTTLINPGPEGVILEL